MAQTITQLVINPQPTLRTNFTTEQVALFNADGTPNKLGAFKQTAARADVAAATSVVAAGATPTKAEYDALRADYLALRTAFNDLLAKLRTAGILA